MLEETYQEAIKKPPSTPPVSAAPEPRPVQSEARADRWVTVLAAASGGAAVALVMVRAGERLLRRR